ncbi:MAG: UDP-N-acetylmuramoyl-L-alanine--D-glutamate ligase, partial [Deltaproteobacteria bacterium]|nr:UDP-N-acetylmuramoyl-L-alanine--D-glutamate ligase [Deltaproteobacteria bacterium]
LIGAALQASGIACHLGGNIGTNPLVFLPELEAHTVTVLELSSFQLMDLNGDHPAVAVILRTSTEHLDWHRDVKEYRAAKSRLLSPPTRSQTVIYCADSEGAREIAAFRGAGGLGVSLRGPVAEGLGVAGGHVLRFASGGSSPRPALDRLSLPGAFSLENAGAAQLAAEALGADPARAAAAIAAFTGLPHRLERVGVVRGVTCYNDSYATRPDATLGALASFQEPLAIILGGSEKHADFRELGERLCAHPSLRRIVLIGTTAPRIAGEVAAAAERLGITPPPLHPAPTLDSAFQAALEALPEGGVLLFSPACASFDMFPNYKVRGERFRALVTPPSL